MIDIFQAWLMHVFPTFTSIHGFLHACISYIILLSLTHTSGLRTLREGPFSLAFSASSHIHVSVAFQKLHHPANLLLQEPQLKCTTELLNEQKEPTEAGSVYLPCWFFWATTCICLMAYFSLLFFAGEKSGQGDWRRWWRPSEARLQNLQGMRMHEDVGMIPQKVPWAHSKTFAPPPVGATTRSPGGLLPRIHFFPSNVRAKDKRSLKSQL